MSSLGFSHVSMDRGVKGKANRIPKDNDFSFVWSGSATVSAFGAVICSRGSLLPKDAIQNRNHFRNYSKLSLLVDVKYPQLCKQNNWNRSIVILDYYHVSDYFSWINKLFSKTLTYKTNFHVIFPRFLPKFSRITFQKLIGTLKHQTVLHYKIMVGRM